MKAEGVEVSVVVPVYRCSDCLDELCRRLKAVLEPLAESYELVFVDDRSPDDSWRRLEELARLDSRVRAIRLSRNFGQQAALTAGLTASRGEFTVVMDCDLEHPPEVIPRLYAKAREGYDVVFGKRVTRAHSRLRLGGSGLYFRVLRLLTGVDISGAYGSFSIISAKVRREFLRLQDQDRHYVPILLWLGFERAEVDFEQSERFAGESSYSLGSLIRLASEGVFFQTTTLLRWIVYAGFGVAAFGALLALAFIVAYVAFDPYPGWTSLAVLLLLLSGSILVSIGTTGLYVGKIFRQVKGRPLYVVDTDTEAAEEAADVHPRDLAATTSDRRD